MSCPNYYKMSLGPQKKSSFRPIQFFSEAWPMFSLGMILSRLCADQTLRQRILFLAEIVPPKYSKVSPLLSEIFQLLAPTKGGNKTWEKSVFGEQFENAFYILFSSLAFCRQIMAFSTHKTEDFLLPLPSWVKAIGIHTHKERGFGFKKGSVPRILSGWRRKKKWCDEKERIMAQFTQVQCPKFTQDLLREVHIACNIFALICWLREKNLGRPFLLHTAKVSFGKQIYEPFPLPERSQRKSFPVKRKVYYFIYAIFSLILLWEKEKRADFSMVFSFGLYVVPFLE